MPDDDYAKLRQALLDLDAEKDRLKRQIEIYSQTLHHTLEQRNEFEQKFTDSHEELTKLRDYLANLRQTWADERCSEWGHFTEDGHCTDCGRTVESP